MVDADTDANVDADDDAHLQFHLHGPLSKNERNQICYVYLYQRVSLSLSVCGVFVKNYRNSSKKNK